MENNQVFVFLDCIANVVEAEGKERTSQYLSQQKQALEDSDRRGGFEALEDIRIIDKQLRFCWGMQHFESLLRDGSYISSDVSNNTWSSLKKRIKKEIKYHEEAIAKFAEEPKEIASIDACQGIIFAATLAIQFGNEYDENLKTFNLCSGDRVSHPC